MARDEREVRNSDRARREIPREIAALADFAAHDIAELASITATAPAHIKRHLLHIGDTMTHLALCVDAISDEDGECAARIAKRAADYLRRLNEQGEVSTGGRENLLVMLIHEHKVNRSSFGPGEARRRNVGFQRDDTDPFGR